MSTLDGILTELEGLDRTLAESDPADFTRLGPILEARKLALDAAAASLAGASMEAQQRLARLWRNGEALTERLRVSRAGVASQMAELYRAQFLYKALRPETEEAASFRYQG